MASFFDLDVNFDDEVPDLSKLDAEQLKKAIETLPDGVREARNESLGTR